MTNKEKLFEAIVEACPELNDEVYYVYNEGKRLNREHWNVQHLLRTANARGIVITISQDGEIFYGNCFGKHLNLDLSKPLSDQSEETLNQLAKVIL